MCPKRNVHALGINAHIFPKKKKNHVCENKCSYISTKISLWHGKKNISICFQVNCSCVIQKYSRICQKGKQTNKKVTFMCRKM